MHVATEEFFLCAFLLLLNWYVWNE